jgi:pimeloyl-ACP methyl ester carboxylesterase
VSARLVAPLAGTLAVLLAAALLCAGMTHARTQALRVGTVTLQRCGDGYPGFCGHIRRALDPGLRGGPTIPIAFEWIPAGDRHAGAPTIVAVEGGPGYPSSGSEEEYAGTFAPALATHNLLMVDNRGTGRSAVIRCPSLDGFPRRRRASGPVFAALVGRCGERLDHLYRTRSHRFIHAADLFATEYAVGDLHAVLDRLRTGPVTLYGDSYGSWFAQAYMARYPTTLRAVILDSTYAIHGLDPYYASSGLSGRAALDRVCSRSLACRTAAPSGSPVGRLGKLLAQLRRAPIRGSVRVPGGRRTISVTPRRLVDLFQDGGSDPYPWRELDASVRAALAGQDTPLERLLVDEDDNFGSSDPGEFSDGDYMAVSCTDYRQLFSIHAPPAVRRRQLAASIAHAPRGAFAPFTAAQWVTMSAYQETYDSCLDWPAPVHEAPLLAPVGHHRLPAAVPVLVVGGDLDDLTPLHDVRRFAPRLGRRVRVVDLHNTVHVTSEGDTYLSDGAACARSIIDRFVAAPGLLRSLDTRCADHIPAVQTPGAYPRTLADARAARTVSGPARSPADRRAVTVAAGALADATVRAQALGLGHGVGLDGGAWRQRDGRFAFDDVRFVSDAAVDGSARALDGVTEGRLTVHAHRMRSVLITMQWNERSRRATAQIGATVLTFPAP